MDVSSDLNLPWIIAKPLDNIPRAINPSVPGSGRQRLPDHLPASVASSRTVSGRPGLPDHLPAAASPGIGRHGLPEGLPDEFYEHQFNRKIYTQNRQGNI